MDKFSFDGTVSIEFPNHTLEGFYGKIVSDDNTACLHLPVDIQEDSENERHTQLDQELKKLYLVDKSAFKIILHGPIDYQATCDGRGIYRLTEELIIPITSAIVSKERSNPLSKLANTKIQACFFNLYSNNSVRSVLRKDMAFRIFGADYSETGNQYKREITLRFANSIDISDAQEMITTIVQTRTFIDGFQNYESDVQFDFGSGFEHYYYISRRKTTKYRWFEGSRLFINSAEEYKQLIELVFLSRQEKAALALLNVLEYLHTNNYSLPTSRYIELVTSMEGYAKGKKQFLKTKGKSEEWKELYVKLCTVVEASEYPRQDIKSIKYRLKLADPTSGKLPYILKVIFQHYFKEIYDYPEFRRLIEDLPASMAEVRNRLSHSPSEYFEGTLLLGDSLVYTTMLLREILLAYLITCENKESFLSSFQNTHVTVKGYLEKIGFDYDYDWRLK